MIPYDDLSRLLDGDLSPKEAEALRARIADEPEVAAAYQTLRGVVDDLADLPETPPPAHLDQAVLQYAPRPVRASPRWTPWLPALAAAALALALLPSLTPSTPVTVLPSVGSTTLLQGVVEMPLGRAQFALDGRAAIRVEPREGGVRGYGDTEVPMSLLPHARTAAISALAGAGITVAVYEGSATVTDADGAVTTLRAGEEHAIAGDAPRARPAPSPAEAKRLLQATAAPAGETPDEAVARLTAENAELRDALRRSETLHAVASGQLATFKGDPSPWPDDIPDGMDPDSFRERADQIAQDLEGVDVLDIDCEEFPCVALFAAGALDDPADLHALAKDVADRVRPPGVTEDDDLGVSLMLSQSGDGDDARALMGVGIVMGDGSDDGRSQVNTRTQFRAEQLLEAHDAGPED